MCTNKHQLVRSAGRKSALTHDSSDAEGETKKENFHPCSGNNGKLIGKNLLGFYGMINDDADE